MKRMGYVLGILFLLFIVSACDAFQNQNLEEVSEAYCRENPESDVCQGDMLEDVSNDTLLDMFDEIVRTYDKENEGTFCDDYFSVTNVAMLDQCREDYDILVPEDLGDYTLKEIVKETSLSTRDVYTITVDSEDGLKAYTFTVGFVKVEETLYLDEWAFETETLTVNTPGENDNDIDTETYQLLTGLFEAFTKVYTDNEFTDTYVCEKYFGPDMQDFCMSDRSANIENTIQFTLLNIHDTGDDTFTLEVLIEFSSTDEGDKYMMLTKIMDKDSEDSYLQISELPEGIEPPEETITLLTSLLSDFETDFNDASLSDDAFCNVYFTSEMQEVCEERSESVGDTVTFTLESAVELSGEVYLLDVLVDNTEDSGESDLVTFEVEIYYDDDDEAHMKIIDLPDDTTEEPTTPGEDTIEQITALFSDYATDYMDDTIEDATLCSMYFTDQFNAFCMQGRESDMASNITFTIKDIWMDSEGYYILTEMATDDASPMDVTLKIEIQDTEPERLIITDIIHEGYPIELFTAFEQFTGALIADFNDESMAPDIFFEKYLGTQSSVFSELRNTLVESDTDLTIEAAYINELGQYTVTLAYQLPGSSEVESFEWAFEGVMDETDTDFIYVDPTIDPVSNEEAATLFAMFLLDFADENMGTAEICEIYFGDIHCDLPRDDYDLSTLEITLNAFTYMDVAGS
ncbi:MAG: hypothetical protein ACQEQA_04915, partial [Bacillota bacterium]